MEGTERWRIGSVDVDGREHRLRRDGQVLPITRKTFALLVALLRRPGELVTKAELFDTVWAGSVVGDAALSRAVHELRSALGDDRAEPRYVATVHGLGFRFVAPVTPLPATAAATRRPERSLIGRDAELRCLDDALAEARAGRRQVVFVSGEAGIGKTALVETFLEGLAGDDAPWVAQGRCIEQFGPGDAHLPVLEALEQLARQVGAALFVEVFSRYAPTWLAQLPWLARDADTAALQRATADTTHQRMVRELAHALDVLCAQRPVVVWLEDLHWCDPSSLEVIAFVAGRRDPARLLLVGTFRPADAAGANRPLQGLALTLAQRSQAQEIPLQLLDAAAVAQVISLRFGAGSRVPCADLGAFIHRRTEGNALFAVTMVDDLVRRQVIASENGRWTLKVDIAELDDRLPDTLRRLVHDQIERLADDDQRLIEAAAVAGTAFSCAAVAAALGCDGADVEDRCARLARQGRLLREQAAVGWPDGTLSAGFGFAHALVWRGVYERVARGRRAEWQRRIALRLERAYGAAAATMATELAMRFEVAGDIESSLRHIRSAGAAALSRCAYPECIEQLRHGLDLVAQLPAGARPRHELDLLLPLGVALMAAQGYASDDVESTYRRALELSREHGQPADHVRALRGMWNVAFLRSDLAGARDVADKLLVQSEALQDVRMAFDAHTKLGQTCLHQADLAAARHHLETALASPAASVDAAGLRGAPRVAAYLAWALWYGGHPAQAARVCDEALDLARRADSPHSSAFALGYVGWVRMMRGELDQAQSLADRQLAISLEYGMAYWRQLAEFLLGAVRVQRGQLPAGIAIMRAAFDDMQASGGRVGVSYLLCLLAEAQLAAGRLADARATLNDGVLLIAAGRNDLHAAEAHRIEGRIVLADDPGPQGRAAAKRCFQAALATARRKGARALELRAAVALARLLADEGDPSQAAALLAPVINGFAEGLETADLAYAHSLLEALIGAANAGHAAPVKAARRPRL